MTMTTVYSIINIVLLAILVICAWQELSRGW